MRPLAIDEFCGAGGASLGLHRAGYDVIGYDAWQTAVDTHNANGLPAELLDLATTTPTPPRQAALLWASPPCQPYSLAGEQQAADDDRDGLPWWLRTVAELLPPVTVMENVAGLATAHRPALDAALAQLTELGYRHDWRILSAADYGVPQTRPRLFVIARRDGIPLRWPEPTHAAGAGMFHRPHVTMAEALGYTGRVVLDRRQTGAPLIDCTERPAPTVTTTAVGKGVWLVRNLDTGERLSLTNDDTATLQGFPPDWRWTGHRRDIARQIGNAVAPAIAEAIGTALRTTEATR